MKENEIINVTKGILEKPGDKLSAEITKTGKQVIKISKNNGKNKLSITHYPTTGSTTKTISTKK